MQHEVTNLNTKNMIADSFKKLFEKETLSKITVSEIIEDCGINRKTFYYHFADLHDLLKWIVKQDAFEKVNKFDLMNDYRSAVVFAIDYISKNERLVNAILSTLTRDEARYLFYDDFYNTIQHAIDLRKVCFNITLSTEFSIFLIKTYTNIVAGLIIEWIFDSEASAKKDRMIDYICTLFDQMLPHMMQVAAEKKL